MTHLAPASDILSVSARMVAAAQAGDWDEVGARETERASLLADLPVSDAAQIETLRTLLAHTEQVRQLAAAARDALGEAMGQQQQRHRALSAYLNAGFD